jgi:hypothetical protein
VSGACCLSLCCSRGEFENFMACQPDSFIPAGSCAVCLACSE